MKFPLYRFSLTKVSQLDLVDEALQSREDFLKEWFTNPLEFKSHGNITIKYHPLQTDQTIITGCFARRTDTLIDCDPADPYAQEDGIHWEKAAYFLNIGNDEQVIALEHKNGVGKPSSLLNGLINHLNDKTNRNAYVLNVHSINNKDEFWNAVKSHCAKDGKITSITFDMVVPNPPDVTSPTKDALKKLKEQFNAKSVKETVSNPNGLRLDNDEVKHREAYIQTGGGEVIAKDGGTTIYNSKNKQKQIEIDDKLYPDGDKKSGLFANLSKLLKR